MNFNELKILEREKKYNRRLFLKMFHIKKYMENTMNFRLDISNIRNLS